MVASEEQLEAHEAQLRADEQARAERRATFDAMLAEAYALGSDHADGLRKVAAKVCAVHAADLLRAECNLNNALHHRQRDPNAYACAEYVAVAAMRTIRHRMRGKP